MTHEQNEKTAIVVSHTHWDREWYLPFQVFRHRLAELVDGLLDLLKNNPEFKCFVLDGQTIVIEDYLELRPERAGELRAHTASGRLLIGPWYVLPDEFLVSGEALVRNLEKGHEIASSFGRVMKIGYVPDPFGHVGALPAILRGFGIDNAMFTRGAGDGRALEKAAFTWAAPCGASVLAVHQLVGGYGNLAHAEDNLDALEARVRELLEKTAPRNPFSVFLLANGTDHMLPDAALPEKIRALNERIPDVRFVQGGFDDLLERMRAENPRLERHTGELRGSRYHSLLPGVMSARMYIKQANAETQNALAHQAEPLAAAAALLADAPYPHSRLDAAWRLLLQNHPHDSICGCSVDQVHREMTPRFDQARQIADNTLLDSAAALAGAMPERDGVSVIAFNTLGARRTDVCSCALPLDDRTRPLLDGEWVAECDGKTVPVSIEKTGGANVFSDAVYFQPDNVEIRFVAPDVPSFGWKRFAIRPKRDGDAVDAAPLKLAGRSIENEFFLVRVLENGSLHVKNKVDGAEFSGLNLFEDEGDAGDEYDFSPTAGKPVSTLRAKANVEPLALNAATAALRIHLPLRLPVGLLPDDSRATAKALCILAVDVALHAGVPRIDVRTVFDNRACGHRLRAVFPLPFRAAESAADSAFEIARRPCKPPRGADWHQKPYNTHPMQSFFDVSDDARGLTVISRGLPEYEAAAKRSGATAFLTLLRCVDRLSRVKLPGRGDQAGPDLPTPEAQCQGVSAFDYSIHPHAGGIEAARPWLHAAAFNNPLIVVADHGASGGRSVALKSDAAGGILVKRAPRAAAATLGESGSLLDFDSAAAAPTSLRIRPAGGLELRFFNPSANETGVRLTPPPGFDSAERTDMLGEPIPENRPAREGGAFKLTARPGEIVTLRFGR